MIDAETKFKEQMKARASRVLSQATPPEIVVAQVKPVQLNPTPQAVHRRVVPSGGLSAIFNELSHRSPWRFSRPSLQISY
jgi:hypothetical protein